MGLAGLAIAALGLAAQPPSRAHQRGEASLQFEVASIKPNPSGDFRKSLGPAPGGFSAMNVTLRELIPMAYEIPASLSEISILGGPDWVDTERFDIEAKTGVERLPAGQIAQMLRVLLADRFRLKAHKETRERPVYLLATAEADRRLGPRLRPAAYDCAARRAALARKETPQPLPPPGPDGRGACTGQSRPGRLFSSGFSLDWLADSLAPSVNRVVLDKTGLTGGFDFELEWTPEQMPPARADRPEPVVDPTGPSIFTALREQLGLKLESSRAPVDVVVIDSAERPTPN
jgi:uncharacterized protein (TIGR03435 family)